MFTQVRSASRRVSPASPDPSAQGLGSAPRSVMKAVYVVLEPPYNALTTAAIAMTAAIPPWGSS